MAEHERFAADHQAEWVGHELSRQVFRRYRENFGVGSRGRFAVELQNIPGRLVDLGWDQEMLGGVEALGLDDVEAVRAFQKSQYGRV